MGDGIEPATIDHRHSAALSGENILSIQMENGLYEHRAVLEGVVVPVPDERWGRCPGGGA